VTAATFFREAADFEDWERIAMDACVGRVLDVGAAAGATSLELQGRGHVVVALDVSPDCVTVMEQRGVDDARCATLAEVDDGPFDTVLFLMHGIGIVGDLDGLRWALADLHRIVASDGQILLDSREPDTEMSAADEAEAYPGVTELWMEYRGQRGSVFWWLFVDEATLAAEAAAVGWHCETLWRGAAGRFVARLTPRSGDPQERV
jgi:SAM-dependent methyltransferase